MRLRVGAAARLSAVRGLLRILIDGRGRRGAVLMFPELLNIAEGRDAF